HPQAHGLHHPKGPEPSEEEIRQPRRVGCAGARLACGATVVPRSRGPPGADAPRTARLTSSRDRPPVSAPPPPSPGPARALSFVLFALALATLAVWVLRPADDGIALVGPASSPDGYRLWATRTDGTAVRWDPCHPIEWVLWPDRAPAG